METKIVTVPAGYYAVQNEDGSYVGFGKTREITEGIKARADKATADREAWEAIEAERED